MEEHDKKGFYRLLEATPNATLDDLKRSYRRLALRHHPDVEQDPSRRRLQHERMRNLNEAYKTLRDPMRRSEYDNECRFPRCKLHPVYFISGRCSRCSEVVCPSCCKTEGASPLCSPCEERAVRRRRVSDPVERALLALEDGEIDLAHQSLTEALLVNPRNVVALTALSTVREKRGDCRGAVEMLRMALQIKPGHAFSYYRLGMLYHRLGDIVRAQSSYEEAVRQCPGNQKYSRALSLLCSGPDGDSHPQFRPNDCVAHAIFGNGIVTEVTSVGVRVSFPESGCRWLDPTRAPMVRRSPTSLLT